MILDTDRYSEFPRALRVKVYTAAERAAYELAHPEKLVATPEPALVKQNMHDFRPNPRVKFRPKVAREGGR